jgi:hypothetical protein
MQGRQANVFVLWASSDIHSSPLTQTAAKCLTNCVTGWADCASDAAAPNRVLFP